MSDETRPEVERASLELSGEEFTLLRTALREHVARVTIAAAQAGTTIHLLRTGAMAIVALDDRLAAAIESLPEDQRPKPDPSTVRRGERR